MYVHAYIYIHIYMYEIKHFLLGVLYDLSLSLCLCIKTLIISRCFTDIKSQENSPSKFMLPLNKLNKIKEEFSYGISIEEKGSRFSLERGRERESRECSRSKHALNTRQFQLIP